MGVELCAAFSCCLSAVVVACLWLLFILFDFIVFRQIRLTIWTFKHQQHTFSTLSSVTIRIQPFSADYGRTKFTPIHSIFPLCFAIHSKQMKSFWCNISLLASIWTSFRSKAHMEFDAKSIFLPFSTNLMIPLRKNHDKKTAIKMLMDTKKNQCYIYIWTNIITYKSFSFSIGSWFQ